MNLEKKNCIIAFFIALLASLLIPLWFPHWNLMLFPSFLAILIYRKNFLTCLWIALACGLILDLLSSSMHLGLFAISFTSAMYFLFRLRLVFFADRLMTLPIMTFFFSSLIALLYAVVNYLFESPVNPSLNWILSDLIFLPLMDSLLGFLAFILPNLIWLKGKVRKTNSSF